MNKRIVDLPKEGDQVYVLSFDREITLSDCLEKKDIKILPCTVSLVSSNGAVVLKNNKAINGHIFDIWVGLSDYQYRYFKLESVAKTVRDMIIHSWGHTKNQIDIPIVIHIERQR